MSNVPVHLSKDATFQNLVVKGQSTFEFGTFNKLTTTLVDSETVSIDTLTVDTLNQSNSIAGNPFAGVVLNPNELVALTSTKTLTTFPYSQDAISDTVIQRTATNSVNANYLAGIGIGNQLVLGTAPLAIALSATQNGFDGALGFGSASSAQLLLSGSSAVVNQQSGLNQLSINEDAGGAPMSIRAFLETGVGQESAILFTKADLEKWRLAFVDLPGNTGRLELRNDLGNAFLTVHIGDPQLPIEIQGNIIPSVANTYQLGVVAQRWGALHLTTQQLTGIAGAANFTDNPATGLGTTVALLTSPQSAASITFTNTALLATSPLIVQMSAYGGTDGIPMFQFNRSTGSVIVINAFPLVVPLNGTATFSFGIVNSNGTGP